MLWLTNLNKMKKQNINNKLVFNKAAVAELNHSELLYVNGGSSTGCVCDAVRDVIKDITNDFSVPQISL
jgi:hypothetical protein